MSRFPWNNNTSEDIAEQTNPRYETPQGAQIKADEARDQAVEIADAALDLHRAMGADEHPLATVTEAGFMSATDKEKADSSEFNAEPNQNAFANINGIVASNTSDQVSYEQGTGISITTDFVGKKIKFTATGTSTPGPHAESHLTGGSDPIPVATALVDGLAPKEMVKEVSDARTSGVYSTTYSNVDARFEADEQRIKDLQDRANWLVYDVKAYGAKGDGSANDTAAIQSAINAASVTSGTVHWPPGVYAISQTLTCKAGRPLSPAGNNSDLFFSDLVLINQRAAGRVVIKATATMQSMMLYTSDDANGRIGPYFSKVEGLVFEGNDFATHGLRIRWTAGMSVENNLFKGSTNAITVSGYGQHQIKHNKICTTVGINLLRGGDNLIQFNDFYPRPNGTAVKFITVCGNCDIVQNTFNRDAWSGTDPYGTLVGVLMDGGKRWDFSTDTIVTADASVEIRDVTIRDNEFCGINTAVSGIGFGPGQNLYNCTISANNVNPFGTSVAVQLIKTDNCADILVEGNFIGAKNYPDLTSMPLEINYSNRISIKNNRFINIAPAAVQLIASVDCEFVENKLIDVGKLGASYASIVMFGASLRNEFKRNRFVQSSANYAQNGVAEADQSNFTTATDNYFSGMSAPYTKVGANSIMQRRDFGTSAPTSGKYYQGDIRDNSAPSAAGSIGFVCVTSGSPGTWKTFGAIQA